MYPPPRIYFQAEHSRSVFTFVLLRSDKEGWIQNPADGAGMFLWCKWVGRSPPCKWGAPNKWVSTYQSIETLRSQLFQSNRSRSFLCLLSTVSLEDCGCRYWQWSRNNGKRLQCLDCGSPVLGGDEFVTNWWEVPWRRLPLPTLCVTILYHRCRWPRARRSHLIVFARGFKQGAGEGGSV